MKLKWVIVPALVLLAGCAKTNLLQEKQPMQTTENGIKFLQKVRLLT